MAKGLKIQGLESLQKQLEQLTQATTKKVLRSSGRKALNVYVKDAKGKVPVDTGNLKKSIGIISAKRQGKEKVNLIAGPRRAKGKEMQVDGETVMKGEMKGYHAHLVEFGTVEMPAQPYLRPALDATQDQIIKTYSEEIWTQIKIQAKKGNK